MAQLSKPNPETRRIIEQLTALQVQTSQATFTQHIGPLPDPETLANYDRTMPGLADRIVHIAESESAHRRDLEGRLLTAQIDDAKTYRGIEKTGQHYALIICVLTITLGFVAIFMGHSIAGSSLSGGTIATLAALFIYGRERKIAEAKEHPASPGKPPEQKQLAAAKK